MMPQPKYVVQVEHLDENEGPLSTERHQPVGQGLETARAALASIADAMTGGDERLMAMPNTARFMARAGDRSIRIYHGNRVWARLTLLDLSLKHCTTCQCGVMAR